MFVEGSEVEAFPEAVAVPDLTVTTKQQQSVHMFTHTLTGRVTIHSSHLKELVTTGLPDNRPQVLNGRASTQ